VQTARGQQKTGESSGDLVALTRPKFPATTIEQSHNVGHLIRLEAAVEFDALDVQREQEIPEQLIVVQRIRVLRSADSHHSPAVVWVRLDHDCPLARLVGELGRIGLQPGCKTPDVPP